VVAGSSGEIENPFSIDAAGLLGEMEGAFDIGAAGPLGEKGFILK
jgi:hypothetical protein